MSNEEIVRVLTPVLQRLPSLNLADPAATREALDAEFPLSGPLGESLRKLTDAGLREGWLCKREAGPSRFSRVAKVDTGLGYSIDAVLLWGDGPKHTHVEGEVNCMIALEGEPEFCGFKPGWAVFPPGSSHVPSVSGGKMMIFYMLPNGAVKW